MEEIALQECIKFLHEAINSKSEIISSRKFRNLIQNFYQLLNNQASAVQISCKLRGKFCLGCKKYLYQNQLQNAVGLWCNPTEHFMCSEQCLKNYAMRMTNSSLLDLEKYVKCPDCASSIPYDQLNDVFQGRIQNIQADAADRALKNLLSEEELRALNPKFKCEICITDKDVEEGITLECDHRFCVECIKMYVEGLIESAQVTSEKLKCPNCPQPLTIYEIEDIVPTEQFDKYQKFLLRGFVLPEDEDRAAIFNCPGADCEFFCIVDKDLDEFQCPSCSHKCCPRCKNEVHKGFTCEQYQEWRRENSVADSKFDEMMKREGLMKCPKCGTVIEKISGCQYMSCTSSQCQGRTYLCWECGKNIEADHGSHHCENRFAGKAPIAVIQPIRPLGGIERLPGRDVLRRNPNRPDRRARKKRRFGLW